MICPSVASYSACGEDLLICAWLAGRDDYRQVRYLDIGAAHPWRLSNTFLLYSRGATGVLVEPDPDQAKRLTAARPRDVVINAGAAFDQRRKLTLTRLTNPMFNSFSHERATDVVKQSRSWPGDQRQEIIDNIEVEMVSLGDILCRHFNQTIHFISIDTEGDELAILKSVDFSRFSPLLVCIEAHASIEEHLQVLGASYRLVFQGPDNFIFSRL